MHHMPSLQRTEVMQGHTAAKVAKAHTRRSSCGLTQSGVTECRGGIGQNMHDARRKHDPGAHLLNTAEHEAFLSVSESHGEQHANQGRHKYYKHSGNKQVIVGVLWHEHVRS